MTIFYLHPVGETIGAGTKKGNNGSMLLSFQAVLNYPIQSKNTDKR